MPLSEFLDPLDENKAPELDIRGYIYPEDTEAEEDQEYRFKLSVKLFDNLL